MPIVTEVPPEYRGREQTWIKHLILRNYLEKLAYKILSVRSKLVYVDGFSGPWANRDDDFQDTSFGISVRVLRQVRDKLAQSGRTCMIRCVFVERDPEAFARLDAAARTLTDLEIVLLRGAFEEKIQDIVSLAAGRFALTFIDPTGWTGYALDRIGPILIHEPGEVLVNFMFNFVNRFIGDPKISGTLTPLFGPDWGQRLRNDLPREDAVIDLFRRSLKASGKFKHVLATPVSNPNADRTHFYLVYGTRHPEGLRVFRNVERDALKQQEFVRENIFRERRQAKTGMADLFAPQEAPAKQGVELEICQARNGARRFILDRFSSGQSHLYGSLWVEVIEQFPLREIEVNSLVRELIEQKILTSERLPARMRTLKDVTCLRSA